MPFVTWKVKGKYPKLIYISYIALL